MSSDRSRPGPRPLRLLFFNSVRAESFGGGERWMVTIARSLADRGHEVTLAGRPGAVWLERGREAGLSARQLAVRGDADPATLARLRRLYGETSTDVVVANFNKDVRLAGLARFPRRSPRVLARNGLAILPDNLRYRSTYRWLADAIVTNTESIRQRYERYGWLPDGFVHVIHNGIALPPEDARAPADVRASLGLPAGGLWVGGFGRLVTQKRFDLLLDAISVLRQDGPAIHLLLVGDGPEAASLAERARRLGIEACVHAVGFQPSVWDWYRSCDLVALTSASEGLPNAVLEAMALGRPVVAFDVGGVRELIPDDAVGRVVPPGDVAAWVDAARLLLSNPVLRAAIGQAARSRVEADFSLEAMASRMERLLSRLTGAS